LKVIWTPRARRDLLGIQAYLSQRSPKGAKRVINRILERVAAQVHSPLAAPIEREGPERRLVVTRTPYLVMYDVSGEALRVVAIYHAMQQRS
jgi:toxin ParE1/3/4